MDQDLAKVSEHFCNHSLLKSCQRAFVRYQANMAPLLFSPEEVFCEAAIILDHIYELPQSNEVQIYIASLWNQLRIKLCKWEKTATQQNLDMAISSILYTVSIATSRHWTTFYNYDVTQWILQSIMEGMKVDHQEMERVFSDLLEDSDGIEDWVNNEYDGALSIKIMTIVKGVSSFVSTVINPRKVDIIISRLHVLMEGKTKPKDVMMPIRAAIDAGVIRRPTSEEFYDEFGKERVKGKSSVDDYTNPDKTPYTGSDYLALVEEFKGYL
jgi:hypothetical protein